MRAKRPTMFSPSWRDNPLSSGRQAPPRRSTAIHNSQFTIQHFSSTIPPTTLAYLLPFVKRHRVPFGPPREAFPRSMDGLPAPGRVPLVCFPTRLARSPARERVKKPIAWGRSSFQNSFTSSRCRERNSASPDVSSRCRRRTGKNAAARADSGPRPPHACGTRRADLRSPKGAEECSPGREPWDRRPSPRPA